MAQAARRRVAIVPIISLFLAGSGQAPDLPARDSFLADAREALTRSQQIWHRYAYKERRTELHLNPFGRMGTSGTRVTEVRPALNPKFTYTRVIERDGVAVDQATLDRQDAEYRARLARALQDGSDPSVQRRNEDLLAKKRAQMMVEDVVNTLDFTLVRRELRNGRPAIVVSFAAKPNARPTTREGRIAKVFRGQMWIDEASRELTDVRATAVGDVSFGGFIAKIYEGTEAIIERREIDAAVWMPTRMTLSGDFRALFRRTHIDHVIEWFDYKPLP
jgi:hypothetical protein